MPRPRTEEKTTLRDAYAQYFLITLDARLNDDEDGRRKAQDHLEATLATL